MNTPKREFDKADILPFVVLCLCLINLYNRPLSFAEPSVYVSAFGLLSVVIYFFVQHVARILFIVWTVVQLVLVRNSDPSAANVLDLSQGFNLPLYLPVTMGGDGYQIGINFIPLMLLVLMEFLRSDRIIGEYLYFSAYRYDNSLSVVFPLKGKVERQVSLSGEKDWLLVNLNPAFKLKDKPIQYVLIRRNDKQPVVKNMTNQLVFFKPVADISSIRDGENDKNEFKEEVWALCK